jgi:hypothetical protein
MSFLLAQFQWVTQIYRDIVKKFCYLLLDISNCTLILFSSLVLLKKEKLNISV